MGFCEFLSESPLGNVGLGVWQVAVQRREDFIYIRGPSPPSWASLFTERLVLSTALVAVGCERLCFFGSMPVQFDP